MSLLNIDPTRSVTLRLSFVRETRKLFRSIIRDLITLIVTEDAFGLGDDRVENAKKLTGGEWRTIRGVHVYIKGGKIVAGPPSLKGKTEAEVGGGEHHTKPAASHEKSKLAKHDAKMESGESLGAWVSRQRKSDTESVMQEDKSGLIRTKAGFEKSSFEAHAPNKDEVRTIHNHPDNTPPSVPDVRFFLARPSTELGIIGAKGDDYILRKTDKTPKEFTKADQDHFHALEQRIREAAKGKKGKEKIEVLSAQKEVKELLSKYHIEMQHGKHLIDKEIGLDGATHNTSLISNKRWSYKTQAEQIEEFEKWLKDRVDQTLMTPAEAERWKKFITRGQEKGTARAFDDLLRRKGRGNRPIPRLNDERAGAYIEGRREQFIRQTLSRPVAIEKLKRLQSQALSEVRGMSSDLITKGRRVLSDGLSRNLSPRELAGKLVKVLKVSEGRAETIAYTELVRAHAEAQLDAMESLGVKEVGVAIEWSTSATPCKACEPMKGVVLKVGEARGMIPRHPRCKCAWVPANIGEDKDERKTQKRSKTKIDRAIKKSRKEAGDDFDAAKPITKDRPKSEIFTNAMCSCSENELTFSSLLHQLGII